MKWLFLFAGISGMSSVMLGAFGAHALKERLAANMLNAYQTAVEYQMYHSLALMISCLLVLQWPESVYLKWSSYGFCLGILLFSGSLYLLSLTGFRLFGPLTPLGGLVLIGAWLLLTLGIWENYQV
jgi:uncharacterized membrane protein YgdD (TMEM256/DUF423 family)